MPDFSSPTDPRYVESQLEQARARPNFGVSRQSDLWYVVSLPNGDFEIRYREPPKPGLSA